MATSVPATKPTVVSTNANSRVEVDAALVELNKVDPKLAASLMSLLDTAEARLAEPAKSTNKEQLRIEIEYSGESLWSAPALASTGSTPEIEVTTPAKPKKAFTWEGTKQFAALALGYGGVVFVGTLGLWAATAVSRKLFTEDLGSRQSQVPGQMEQNTVV